VKKLLGLIAVLLFGTAHAQIYNNQTTLPPFALANSRAGNNAVASTPMQFGILNVFDVRNYGAACNGTTDDHAAWQSAINSAAALAHFSGSPLPAKIVGCQTGQSLITTTLNFTGFSSFGTPYALALTVDMSGTCLIGETNGTPVIDALSSRYISWEHLCIFGSARNPPNIGLQIGRSTTQSADVHYFNRPVITGAFTFTAWYNEGSEDITAVDPVIWNNYATGPVYAVVQDGYNHWHARSAFVTVTAPVDTNQSFGNNIFIGGWVGGTGPNGIPFWIANASHHQFIGGYASTTGTTCVVLYTEITGNINDLKADLHCETTAITNEFLISGPQATPTFTNFTYNNRFVDASNSIFKLDTGVTSATIDGGTIEIGLFSAGNRVKVFDSPNSWKYSGSVYIPNIVNWSAVPATFSGSLCAANVCDGYKNPGGTLTNTASGNDSMAGAVTGTGDTGYGFGAAGSIASQSNITAIGFLAAPTSGGGSTAVGSNALRDSTVQNTAVGVNAGQFVTSGAGNSFFGANAGEGVIGTRTTGYNNTGIGASTLIAMQGTATKNSALGQGACATVTIGSGNTCLGYNAAGTTLTTGSNNLVVATGAAAITTPASGTNNWLNINNVIAGNMTALTSAALSSCGTTPAINAQASDLNGTITTGSGATACTLTFSTAKSVAPSCVVTGRSGTAPAYATSTGALTLSRATALAIYDYYCSGY
jgi:hypothetical protein